MEIPSVVLDGLCSLGELDGASFAHVVDGVYDTLSGKISTQELLKRLEIEQKENIVDSLMLFIAEACRRNVNPGTIGEVLQDLQFPPERVSRFLASHKVKHLTLKSVLAGTKPGNGSIVDVRWKLEFARGDGASAVGPRYSIHLTTDKEPLHFYCSPAQLDDLVSSLQSATFSIDKFISSQNIP